MSAGIGIIIRYLWLSQGNMSIFPPQAIHLTVHPSTTFLQIPEAVGSATVLMAHSRLHICFSKNLIIIFKSHPAG